MTPPLINWIFANAALDEIQGDGLIDGGKAPTLSGNTEPHYEKCKEFIKKAYEQISVRASFDNVVQPDVQKKSPPRTCKDLFIAHPDLPNGNRYLNLVTKYRRI